MWNHFVTFNYQLIDLYINVSEGSPTKRSSNQINSSESKKKTDYENLLLLKKILGAKPSKYVRESFSVGNEAI